MTWQKLSSASKMCLSNYQAFRKLAATCGLNGFQCCSSSRITYGPNGIPGHMKYHVLASNCVLRNNYTMCSDSWEKNRTDYIGFQYSYFDRLNNRNALLRRNLLTRTYLNTHTHRNRNKVMLQNGILNSWKDSFSSRRQFSLNPKEILEATPQELQPFLKLIRFDKPIGTYLLFWPCTWSIGLAAEAGHLPNLYLLWLFGLGSFLMRGSGCIINDMWDKEIDKRVERTKSRPLASGELSEFQALCFLGMTLSMSLGILLQLNFYSFVLGASSMILVILYPLAKRFTYWPQLVLGLTLNFGVLLAWSGLHGSLEWPVIPLYMACVTYTMFYDTIYSHQDKYDDMLVGVKSTALKLGDKTKPWLVGFSGLMLSGLTTAGYMCDQTWPYYLAVGATGAHLWYQLFTVDLENPDDCFAKFKSNSRLGLVMFLGIVAGTLLKKPTNKEEPIEEA